jgi:hypothetical protein
MAAGYAETVGSGSVYRDSGTNSSNKTPDPSSIKSDKCALV